MGEIVPFNPLGWPDGLASGPAPEVEHIATTHGVRLSLVKQAEAPGHFHVTVTDEATMGSTGVAIVPDTDDGRKLGRFVARAVLRSLDAVSWVPKHGTDPFQPEADHSAP